MRIPPARARSHRSHRITAVALFAAIAAIFPVSDASAAMDGPDERLRFQKEVQTVFLSERWDELETLAGELRTTKARFPEGVWKLSHFYRALDVRLTVKNPKEKDWKRFLAKLGRWQTASPDSITAPVAMAKALTGYAWDARGGGYGYTVTEAGGKQFAERLAQARTTLETAAKLPERCPGWFHEMQIVALGQGWNRAEYESLFAKAIAAEPDYQDYYFDKAVFLLPRWYGRPGEWESFAEEAAGIGQSEGRGIYTRIAWSLAGFYQDVFKETRIEWPKMKEGFLALEKLYPDSIWNLNNFAAFAVMAGDRDTARALIERIGQRPLVPAWKSRARFESAKSWAAGEAGPEPVQPLARLRLGREWARAVAFSPDGKLLVVGHSEGTVAAWRVSDLQLAWTIEAGKQCVSSIAFSPDGKLLATGLGKTNTDKAPGSVKVWDVPTRQLRATLDGFRGLVSVVAFTPDGSKLYAVGGTLNVSSEAWCWDVASGQAHPVKWMLDHKHMLLALGISPDGKTIVVDCNRNLSVGTIDPEAGGAEHGALALPINMLAFTPDGKKLVATLTNNDGSTADIAVFDAATWDKKRLGDAATAPSTLEAMALSPDGRILAAGGRDAVLYLWDIRTGERLGEWLGHRTIIGGIAFSPDGKTLASADMDGGVFLWKSPTVK